MHVFLLIPLLTLVLSCIVGSGTVARDVSYRPNHVVAAAMFCTGAWSVLEIAYSVQTDPEAALRIVRLLGFVYLPLAPLVIELLSRLGLVEDRIHARLRVPTWAVTAGLAVAHASTPWFIEGVVPTSYGWRYEFGPAFWPGVVATLGGCAACSLLLMRRPRRPRSDAGRLRWFGAVLWLPILVACATDVALPALAIDAPRLGAASIVLSTGALWMSYFAGGNPDVASSALARQFLDRLPDGIAILRLDGTLRAANERLPGILERDLESLLGRPASEWLGTEGEPEAGSLRERRIATPSGPIPVALRSSEIVDRAGTPIGRVLVVREQRALVELRRQEIAAGQMSALGALAAGIAHEVNNPIAYVLANLNQLERSREELAKTLPRDPAIGRAGASIEACTACLRPVVDFVAEVRSFAHPERGVSTICRVEDVVAGAMRLAAPKLRGRHVASQESSESCELRCCPQELKHALLCLLLSVGQELEPPGRIRIHTRPARGGAEIEILTDRALEPAAWSDGAELLLQAGSDLRPSGLLVPRHLLREQGGSLEIEPDGADGTRIRVHLAERSERDALPPSVAVKARP